MKCKNCKLTKFGFFFYLSGASLEAKGGCTFDWIHGISIPMYFLVIGLEVVLLLLTLYIWCLVHDGRRQREDAHRADIERGFVDTMRRASDRLYQQVSKSLFFD